MPTILLTGEEMGPFVPLARAAFVLSDPIAATRMNQAQIAYRAAIGAVSIANQATLIDFLK